MANPSDPVKRRRCLCCEHYSERLSARQFCERCEDEFIDVVLHLRELGIAPCS